MRSRGFVALFALGALVFAVVAEAANRPPPTTLNTRGDSAKLNPSTYSWTYEAGGSCAQVNADGVWSFEPLVFARRGWVRPGIRLHSPLRPRVQSFEAYARLDDHDNVTGNGKPVRYRVRSRSAGGDVVSSTIRFGANVRKRPYFVLVLDIGEPAVNPCREGGEAFYGFAIGRKKAIATNGG